ncbi:MAG: hypothetical protein QM756_07360 [Polyangiaceae bacterium]
MTIESTNNNQTFDIMKMGRQVVAKQRRKRAARAALGSAMIATGAVVKGWLGVLSIGTGAYVVMRAVRDGVHSMISKRPKLGSHDAVDEASFHSFPASDPPAMSGA